MRSTVKQESITEEVLMSACQQMSARNLKHNTNFIGSVGPDCAYHGADDTRSTGTVQARELRFNSLHSQVVKLAIDSGDPGKRRRKASGAR